MNVTFVSPNADVPLLSQTNHGFFDVVMMAVFVAGILLARRLSPLSAKRWPLVLSVVLMTPLSIAAWLSLFTERVMGLVTPLTVIAAVGGTLVILLWSERYAGLPPYKVLIGLTGSYALGAVLIFVLNGFYPAYLVGFSCLLPLGSMLCLARTKSLGYSVAGLVRVGRGTIPWRLVAIMVLYNLSIGLSGARAFSGGGAVATAITFGVSGVYFASLVFSAPRASSFFMQKLPPLLIVLGFLAVALSPFLGQWVAGPLIVSSYMFYYFFVDTSLCDIARRFGISGVWLFSIEEAAAMGSEQLGEAARLLFGIEPLSAADAVSPMVIALLAVVALVGAWLLLDEKGLKTHWGIRFLEKGSLVADSDKVARIEAWVSAAVADHGLSPREEEVLALLAEGKSLRQVAAVLVVSEGTVKTHASHIYEKLGVRNKRELERVVSELG